MKKLSALLVFFALSAGVSAQKGYDIRFNLKGLKDTTMYLAKYYFDQTAIIDSAKHIKNGVVRFKGSDDLTKGMYILATQAKGRYIEFLVDDTQRFSISGDEKDLVGTLRATDSRENEEMLSYARFMSGIDKRYKSEMTAAKGKNKADSAKYMNDKIGAINADVKKFDSEFMARNKGTFVHDFFNLRNEKYAPEIPLASNGRPDSTYQYLYYKNHYWEGVNFKDERIMYTPFFATKFKKYFDEVLVQDPDTVIHEIDKIMAQTEEGGTLYTTLLGYFTYKYEQNKAMSFDKNGNLSTFEKVFIHMSDRYITNGKAFGYYSDETVQKIKERIDILRNLQPNAKVPDLMMIDTADGGRVLKLGFDTAKSSSSVTYLFNKHYNTLKPMFKTLYSVKAKYTVLVFWASDCGHCQTEIPKLHEELKSLKGKIDYQVFAVQTKEDLYAGWKKFIIDKKLTDFIHVFDPIHYNNVKNSFDITGTPVIYLLDKDKRIKGKKLSYDQVVDIIKTLDKLDKKP